MQPIKMNFLTKMILSWSSKHFFKTEAFSLTQKLRESRKILICMPAHMNRLTVTKDLLSTLAEIFQGKAIYVFLPILKTEGYLPSPAGYKVIYPNKEDLKIFSIPRKSLIQRLSEHQFDISLDLDLEDGFFNSYLGLKCKIPLRLGARGKRAFPFYNVQLAVSKDKSSLPETYKGLANVLRSLMGGSGANMSNCKQN